MQERWLCAQVLDNFLCLYNYDGCSHKSDTLRNISHMVRHVRLPWMQSINIDWGPAVVSAACRLTSEPNLHFATLLVVVAFQHAAAELASAWQGIIFIFSAQGQALCHSQHITNPSSGNNFDGRVSVG